MPLVHALRSYDTDGFIFGKGYVLFYKAVQQTNATTDLRRLWTEMENGIIEVLIDKTIHIATKIVGYKYLEKDVENLNLVRAHIYYCGTKAYCKVSHLQMTPSVKMFFVQFFKRKFG